MSNKFFADVNEIYLGYFCVNENWNAFENNEYAQEILQKRKQEVAEQVFKDQIHKAKIMANSCLEWARDNNYIGLPIKCWWTAEVNSLKKILQKDIDSKENPTDILLLFEDGNYLGLSAKTTKKGTDIGFKNHGAGTLSSILNIDLQKNALKLEAEAVQKYNLPEEKKTRKIFIRSNPQIRKHTTKIGSRMLNLVRDELYNTLSSMEQEDLRKHIISHWLDAREIYPKYIKVTGHGKNGSYKVTIQDPQKNEKLTALQNNDIMLSRSGCEIIRIEAGEKKICRLRPKFTSEKLATSIKVSGDAW